MKLHDELSSDRRQLLIAGMLLLVLALPCDARAEQVDPDGLSWRSVPAPTDARSTAMGRTGIVSAGGSHGIFANPALIGSLRKLHLQVDGRLFTGLIESHQPAGFQGTIEESYPLNPALNAISVAVPSPFLPNNRDFDFYFGAGYRNYLDFTIDYRKETRNESQWTDLEEKVRGGFRTFNASLAMSYKNRLLFGASWDKSLYAEATAEIDDVVDGQQTLVDKRFDSSGHFFTFGTLLRMTRSLSVAVIYRPALEIEMERDVEVILQGAKGGLVVPGNEGSGDIDVAVPSTFGLAVAFRPSEPLTLAVELQTRPFSDLEIEGQRSELDDSYCYRFGMEYHTVVALRAGVFYDAIPVTDDGSDEDDPRFMLGVTAGLGFELYGVRTDLAFEYARWEKAYEEGSDHVEQHFTLRMGVGHAF